MTIDGCTNLNLVRNAGMLVTVEGHQPGPGKFRKPRCDIHGYGYVRSLEAAERPERLKSGITDQLRSGEPAGSMR